MELRDKHGLTEQEFLKNYRADRYPRPSMTADIVLLSPAKEGVEALLIRRGGHPFLGCWALPGGFVGPEESVDAAAARELEEETHVSGLPLRPLVLSSAPGRDPRAWTISEAYLAVTDRQSLPVQAGDDAADTRWFQISRTGTPPVIQLSLTCDTLCLTATLHANITETACGRIYDIRVNQSEGIAFDHAAILLRALFEWELCQERVEESKLT